MRPHAVNYVITCVAAHSSICSCTMSTCRVLPRRDVRLEPTLLLEYFHSCKTYRLLCSGKLPPGFPVPLLPVVLQTLVIPSSVIPQLQRQSLAVSRETMRRLRLWVAYSSWDWAAALRRQTREIMDWTTIRPASAAVTTAGVRTANRRRLWSASAKHVSHRYTLNSHLSSLVEYCSWKAKRDTVQYSGKRIQKYSRSNTYRNKQSIDHVRQNNTARPDTHTSVYSADSAVLCVLLLCVRLCV